MTAILKKHQTIYNGRIFRVERDVVTLSNGRTVAMEAVRHRGSVVLIPQPSPRHVILIRQFRYVIGRWIWELPAGSLEQGEAPARAARRECEEEIGWRPTRIRRVGMYYPSPGFCDERMTFYACTALVRPRRTPTADPDEQIRARTFTIRAVWDLVANGDVVDMKTIVGLVLLRGAGSGASPRSKQKVRSLT